MQVQQKSKKGHLFSTGSSNCIFPKGRPMNHEVFVCRSSISSHKKRDTITTSSTIPQSQVERNSSSSSHNNKNKQKYRKPRSSKKVRSLGSGKDHSIVNCLELTGKKVDQVFQHPPTTTVINGRFQFNSMATSENFNSSHQFHLSEELYSILRPQVDQAYFKPSNNKASGSLSAPNGGTNFDTIKLHKTALSRPDSANCVRKNVGNLDIYSKRRVLKPSMGDGSTANKQLVKYISRPLSSSGMMSKHVSAAQFKQKAIALKDSLPKVANRSDYSFPLNGKIASQEKVKMSLQEVALDDEEFFEKEEKFTFRLKTEQKPRRSFSKANSTFCDNDFDFCSW